MHMHGLKPVHRKDLSDFTHLLSAALVKELDLNLIYALNTHCHADHVTVRYYALPMDRAIHDLSPA
jgi:hypothetical protein